MLDLSKIPGLAPLKYTPADQLADPDARMTRVVKDFLKIGKWTCGTSTGGQADWDVTADTLTLAAKTFDVMKSNGIKTKLYNGNFRSEVDSQHDIAVTDELGEIDQVIVDLDGEVAYFSAYVTPAEAKRLANSSLEVSPAVAEEWSDSKKRSYKNALQHIAIVDHPVILGQGRFLTLAHSPSSKSKPRFFTLSDSTEGNENMTLFEKLKTKFGFGDEVTADNIDAAIEAKLAAATVKPDATPAPTTAETKELAAKVAKQDATILHLSSQVTKLLAKEHQSEKDLYNGQLDKLFAGGNINAAMKTHLAKVGETHQYDLAILQPFAVVKTLAATKSNTLELATPDEPDVGGSGETDEQRDKRLTDAGYKPLRVISA